MRTRVHNVHYTEVLIILHITSTQSKYITCLTEKSILMSSRDHQN